MSFPFHLPREEGATRRFDFNGASQGSPYNVPLGATMLHILVVGGGGGGGAGFSGAAATARGGGGGGGSGAVSRIAVPTAFLPKVLWMIPGAGGTPGVSGGNSLVNFFPSNAPQTALIQSNGGTNGAAGTASVAGAGGAGGTANAGGYSALGSHVGNAGLVGGAAGAIAGAGGSSVTWGNSNLFITGGAGGGSMSAATTEFSGGQITGTGFVPTILGGTAGVAGRSGFELWNPPTFSGGSGGGTSNAGAGGRGGDGGRGCGGGGGGPGVTGGAGGRGGDGFILVTAVF